MIAIDRDELFLHATTVRANARAKYSGFAVGAALQSSDGKIYDGCNVESSSYGLSICAERVALTKALSEGASNFSRILVVADTPTPVSPCGACRQLLHDYAPDAVVIMANLAGDSIEMKVKELLPAAFDDSFLSIQK